MTLVAGLGNPGRRYAGTRHNIGFAVADEVARRAGVAFDQQRANALVCRLKPGADGVVLVKPLTMMNLSGEAVGELARFYRIEASAVLAVVDDVNLPLGRLRLRAGGSAGGHNGLKSLMACLGTDEFPRVRVGVGRGDPRRDLADHVLARFDPDEEGSVRESVARAADAVETILAEGLLAAMNRFNP